MYMHTCILTLIARANMSMCTYMHMYMPTIDEKSAHADRPSEQVEDVSLGWQPPLGSFDCVRSEG